MWLIWYAIIRWNVCPVQSLNMLCKYQARHDLLVRTCFYLCVCAYLLIYLDTQHTNWLQNIAAFVFHITVGFVKAETQVFPMFLTQIRSLTKAHCTVLADCLSSFLHKETNREFRGLYCLLRALPVHGDVAGARHLEVLTSSLVWMHLSVIPVLCI